MPLRAGYERSLILPPLLLRDPWAPELMPFLNTLFLFFKWKVNSIMHDISEDQMYQILRRAPPKQKTNLAISKI